MSPTEAYIVARNRYEASKRALGLLNHLNTLYINNGVDNGSVANRIRKVFSDMNRLRSLRVRVVKGDITAANERLH